MAADSYGVRFTAKGHGYYRVLVEGEEVSKHTTEREALESASNHYADGLDVRVIHDYEVQVVKNYLGEQVKVRVKTRKLKLNTPMAIISYTSPGLGQTNPDSVPDSFTFTDQTGVAIQTIITSDQIEVTGMTLPAAISISGANSPEYQINNLAWTNNAGTVVAGNTVRVRHEASAFGGQTIETLLTIGGEQGTFRSTTVGISAQKDMVIGLNAGFFNEWADTNYVANLVKTGNIQQQPGNSRDANDYPIGDITGELNVLVLQNYIKGGTYHVRWSGTTAPASVDLTPNTGSTVVNSNEKTFTISAANPGFLTLTVGAGGTLLSTNSGLQVFHADNLARINAGQFCSQQYVDAYSGINHWRAFWPSWGSSSSIIDFIDVNPQNRMNWTFTYAGASHDWTNPGDISLECIVGIANELGGNLFYPLPPKGTDACWESIIDYIGANLTGTLYLTVGNEVWNTFLEFHDNTRWYELGRNVPGFEVPISASGIVTQNGHGLLNGDRINLFARQHETEPYVWGGIAGEVGNDAFSVTNVTANTWQLADHNNIAITSVPISELYYKRRNGNVTNPLSIDFQQMRENYATALLSAWAYADSVMGRARVKHVADIQIGSEITLSAMQDVAGFNAAVDIVNGNAYVNMIDATTETKTDAQILADAIANFDETDGGPSGNDGTAAWWLVRHINAVKAASPNAIFGTYEGDEGSDHYIGTKSPNYFDFISAWKKRDTGGGAFAVWYWQKLADLGIEWHTHFHDAGNWSESRVAGIRENPGDTVVNNAYFAEFRNIVDAGGVDKTP